VAAAASSGRGGSQSVSAARSFLRELRDIREEREKPASEAAPGGAGAAALQFQTPLDVVLYPHPVLRAKNVPVREFNARLEALAEEMFHVMYKTEGVGLSAPQVGVNVRLMVYNPEGCPKRGEEFVLCNPKITKASPETDFMDEGCLSFPGVLGEVERHLSIQVVGQDLKGNPVQLRLRGWRARIVQHEFDHLEGVLYHDRMAPEQRERVRPGLEELEGSFAEAFPDTAFRAMDQGQ
jgi:peptide deformylase